MNLGGMFLCANAATGNHGYDLESNSLPADTSKKCMFRPMNSAILNIKKYFPALLLGAQGLTFELELAPADEACAGSQDYELSDLRIMLDTVQLTSELTDQYTSLLLSGKSIFMNLDMHENIVIHMPSNTQRSKKCTKIVFFRRWCRQSIDLSLTPIGAHPLILILETQVPVLNSKA